MAGVRARLADTESVMKRPSMQIGFGIALGAAIGGALAVVLGAGAAWLGIGIPIGIAIGFMMAKKQAGSSPARFERASSE